jgi:hypothetical protein
VIEGNTGYVVAGYVLTVAALGGYVLRLHVRARAARIRAEAVARRRRSASA